MSHKQENLIDELQRKILQLEGALRRQEEQLSQKESQMQQQLQQQQLYQQQFQQQQFQPQGPFLMQPKDIIQQFRQIRPLENNRNINGFIKSVEMIIGLCENNSELIRFGIQIVINEKITAEFGTYIRELGDITWEQLKTKLRIQARPKTSYAEIFNKCRYIKVSTLRQLFDYFEIAKHQINEIYELDDSKPMLYHSENVDRDLVNILVEKIDGPLRIHLDEGLTLNDIISKYTKLRLLDDSRAIDNRHKANKNFRISQTQNNNSNNGNRNLNQDSKKGKYYGNSQVQHSQNNHNFSSLQQQKYNERNRGNYQSQNFYNNHNNKPDSSQTRLSHMSVDNSMNSRRSHNSKFMEVDTLQEEEKINSDEEANFLELPQNTNYP